MSLASDRKHSTLVAAERAGDVQEAAQLLQLLARLTVDPMDPRDLVKMQIGRAADNLNLDAHRAGAIWWGEARRIDAWEMDALRRAISHRLRSRNQRRSTQRVRA